LILTKLSVNKTPSIGIQMPNFS